MNTVHKCLSWGAVEVNGFGKLAKKSLYKPKDLGLCASLKLVSRILYFIKSFQPILKYVYTLFVRAIALVLRSGFGTLFFDLFDVLIFANVITNLRDHLSWHSYFFTSQQYFSFPFIQDV